MVSMTNLLLLVAPRHLMHAPKLSLSAVPDPNIVLPSLEWQLKV